MKTNTVEVKDIAMLVNAGVIKEIAIMKSPLKEGEYYIAFYDKKLDDTKKEFNSWVLKTQKGKNKVYKSVDAAAEEIRRLGLGKVTLFLV